jgi:uncharacterized protein
MRVPVPLAALAGFLAWAPTSHAASFDCAKATQPAERLICADSALSALDEAMAVEYSRARAAVSEDGRKQLRDNQRSWLKYTAGTCARPAALPTALQCMRDAYQERLTTLKKVPVTRGPFTFIPVERFGFQKSPGDDEAGMAPGWTITVQRYPRIDNPATPEAQRWNAAMAAKYAPEPLRGPDDDAEVDILETFTIHSASPTLISMSSEGYVYPHGAAHGTEGAQTSNHLLPQTRELSPADLFHLDRGWQTFLSNRCFTDLTAQAERDQWTLDPTAPSALLNTATNPENWEITEATLTVRFPVYEVGPYSASTPKIEIPWPDLKPYLATPPTLPIPPH